MQSTPSGGPRRHFNYSNVMSTLSVFLVVAGGTALAATAPSNSVKSKSIKDNTIQGKDVKDDTLTGADVQETSLNIPQQAIPEIPATLPPNGPAGGDLTGTYPDPTIGPNAVGSAEIADNAIANSEMADNAIANSEMADNAVGTNEVAANSLGAADLATNSVGSDEVTDNSLSNLDLGPNSVKGAEFEIAGTFADSFGAFGANACSDRTFDPAGLGGNSLADDLIIVTPDTAWGGDFDDFQVTAEAEDVDTIRLVVCNNGTNGDDPDAGTTTFRYIAIDLS